MNLLTHDDEDPQWEDEDLPREEDVAYGDRAPAHISSNHITAAQHAVLEPLISQYVTLDGAEKRAFVQTVSSAFPALWEYVTHGLCHTTGLPNRMGWRSH